MGRRMEGAVGPGEEGGGMDRGDVGRRMSLTYPVWVGVGIQVLPNPSDLTGTIGGGEPATPPVLIDSGRHGGRGSEELPMSRGGAWGVIGLLRAEMEW